MTALALPVPRKLWLPRFEPWRLLRPLKMNWPEGQWYPRQAIQFESPGWLGAGASQATITYKGTKTDTTSNTSRSFTSCDIGTAAADRYVFVACGGWNNIGGSGSYTSCTINGVSATKITDGSLTAERTTSSSTDAISALFGALVTSGTSVTIACTSTTNMTNTAIMWWITSGLLSLTATEVQVSDSSPSGTFTNAVEAGGVAIGYSVCAPSGGTYSWSGDLTEDNDATIEASAGTHGGASAAIAGAGSLSTAASDTGSSLQRTFVATLR